MLSREESIYKQKIADMLEVSLDCCCVHKKNRGYKTYKELYEHFIQCKQLIEEAKEVVSDYSCNELRKIFNDSYHNVLCWLTAIYSDSININTVRRTKKYLNILKGL